MPVISLFMRFYLKLKQPKTDFLAGAHQVLPLFEASAAGAQQKEGAFTEGLTGLQATSSQALPTALQGSSLV